MVFVVLQLMEGKEESAEKHPLEGVIGSRAKFITNDGRVFVGILKVISEAEERVYSEQAGVTVHRLGTYFMRGDSIVAMGAFAETEEEFEGLEEVKAKPIPIDG